MSNHVTINRPSSSGSHGWPFGAYFGDIGDVGYSEEEYFVSGLARRFAPASTFGLDGKWSVEADGTAPFKTRILVRRPLDASRFNGTLVTEWLNVSAGSDTFVHDLPGLYRAGYAYVAVSSQYVGLNGMGDAPVGLRQWDAQRYGELSHPGDDYAYDIFTQIARSVGPDRSATGIDPLGGLRVEKHIAVGASQSAMRLTTYVNAIQPLERVFDGFLLGVSFGIGSSLDDRIIHPDKLQDLPPTEWVRALGVQSQIREDADVPLLMINSETETPHHTPSRQKETDRFCFWEIAGASHVPLPMMKPLAEKSTREFGQPRASMGASSISPLAASHVSWTPTLDSGLHVLDRWVRTGEAPSRHDPIRLDSDGTTIVRDADGNALGGVRLPDMEAPTAQNDGVGNGLFGHHHDFSAERLRELYTDHESYVSAVTNAARQCESDHTLPPEVVSAYIDFATKAPVPLG